MVGAGSDARSGGYACTFSLSRELPERSAMTNSVHCLSLMASSPTATCGAARIFLRSGAPSRKAGFVRALHREGARILLGTDEPNQFIIAGFAVHEDCVT